MIFTWHAPKAARNIKDHGVSFEEAQTVFDDEFVRHRPDDSHSFGERRFLCTGQSDHNRLLTVVYTEPAPDTIHLISAREATRREQREYEA